MFTLGIDIGSASSDAVILEDGTHIVSKAVFPLGAGTAGPQQAYETVLGAAGLVPEDIDAAVATGYGRMNCPYAKEQLSELSCHAKGIHFLLPNVRTIIDIGGQDAKALRIGPQGQLMNFVMNDPSRSWAPSPNAPPTPSASATPARSSQSPKSSLRCPLMRPSKISPPASTARWPRGWRAWPCGSERSPMWP